MLLFIIFFTFEALSQTPVERHGLLRTSGNRIVDKNNDTVSFAGYSFFWSNTGWGGEKYYNVNVVNYLADTWNTPVIRLAMGVDDPGGYLYDSLKQKQLITKMIDAAILKGMYVIVDWHSHYAHRFQPQAIGFFKEISSSYGNYENIIYEIYNEPTQVSWLDTIKPYAMAVIEEIRKNDPDNLIVVGTPNWSQYVDVAANSPIADTNVAYALHFYAATHKQSLRNRAIAAMNKNAALFITEWGTCNATGGGAIDNASVEEWMNFCRDNRISHINWALNDKPETASLLVAGASVTGGWLTHDLTTSGKIVREIQTCWPELPRVSSDFEYRLHGNKADFDVYPVPFTNYLTIETKENHGVLRIEVFDNVGRQLADYSGDQIQSGRMFMTINSNCNSLYVRILSDSFVLTKPVIRVVYN